MEYVKNSDEEYFGIGIQEQTATIMNFRMINGVIRDSDKFFFDLVGIILFQIFFINIILPIKFQNLLFSMNFLKIKTY